MPVSPLAGPVDNVTVSISIEGKPIADDFHLLAIRTEKEVNGIASAKIHIAIPVETPSRTPFFQSNTYEVGQDIQVAIGYHNREEQIFTGIIDAQQISSQASGGLELVWRCSHKALHLQPDPNNNYFANKGDHEIISQLIAENGLSGEVASASTVHKELIQHQMSDWGFIIERAKTNNWWVYMEDNQIVVKPPLSAGEADLVLTFGLDVIAFNHAHNTRSEKKGTLSFPGNAKPKLNTMIELAGFGKQYSGKVLITKVKHEVEAGTWQTSIDYVSPASLPSQKDGETVAVVDRSFSGINGLLYGTVKKIDEDPDKAHRIQVEVPAISSAANGIWARLSNFYSTDNKGVFFMPEIGDEVILGFLDGDPLQPVILGATYTKKNSPPYLADSENSMKAIITKSDLKLEFNDKDKILSIETPAGNRFVLSDKDRSISTEDQHGNKLIMNNDGISMHSAKNISLHANGKIDIMGNNAITTKSSSDVTVEGLNVKMKAKVALSAEGNASAELTASGQTRVQGAMVMIN